MGEIKVLTGFNEAGYNNEIRDIRETCKVIQSVADKLNAINSFRLDNTSLQNLIVGDGSLVSDGISKTTQQELEKANISSAVLKRTIIKEELESVWETINEFKQKCLPLTDWIRKVEIKDGQVFVPEDVIEYGVKERYCGYIRTEAGLQKKKEYDVLIEAARAFIKDNSYFKDMRSIGRAINQGANNLSFDGMTQPIVNPFQQ